MARATFSGACLLLLPLGISSCNAQQDGSQAEARERGTSASLRPVDELPNEYRELWQAWLDNDPQWNQRREAALQSPKLASFLVDNLVREWMRAYRAGEFTQAGAASVGSFERARAELIVIGAPAAPVLAELVSIASSDIADNASTVLREIGRPSVLPIVSQLERVDLDQARMRAAMLLGVLPYAKEDEVRVREALARRLKEDQHWMVRAKAAEALGRRGYNNIETQSTLTLLSPALSDEDEAVRISAAAGLGRLRDPAAVPALIEYYEKTIDTASLKEIRAATENLKLLTGVPEALDARGWRDWWREHRGKLQQKP